MKKLIFRGPVQTASGYGVHARMLLRALDQSGKFDITLVSVPWGVTPLLYDDSPEQRRIRELAAKFNPYEANPDNFDVSVQVTIPNEFMRMAKTNIGVTAGIEVDRVAAEWLVKTNQVVDLLVVPSKHSYDTFRHTVHRVTDPQQAQKLGVKVGEELWLQKPMMLLPEWLDYSVFNPNLDDPNMPHPKDGTPLALESAPDFNFLTVGLGLERGDGEDRKNIALLVKWFCEQFKDNPKVGLVLKVSMVNFSPVDFKNTRNRILNIKRQAGCGQFPVITLIHGRLGDRELAALYKHPKIKAFITTTHGEGFGLPIAEAAACGLPVLATDWSGQLDFLEHEGKKLFVKLDYELKEIPQACHWPNVMDPGSKYAFPIEADVKMKMAKVVLSYDRPKQWATELAPTIPARFNESLGAEFAQKIDDALAGKEVRIEAVPLSPLVKPYAGPTESLEGITLACCTSVKLNGSIFALLQSIDQLPVKRVKLFTHVDIPSIDPRIEVVKVPPMTTFPEYSKFVFKDLVKYIDTSHVLLVQQDGYVLNGSAWSEEFVGYDYIGAPWFWDRIVGNGGFSIRSKRLMEELAKPEYTDLDPEDDKICRKYRKQLEERGFTWAPLEVASRFSIENQGLDLRGKYEGQLGWHGRTPFYGAYAPN